MIVVGIDPGLTGAVASIDTTTGAARIADIPTVDLMGNGLVKRRVHGRALADLLREMAPACEACEVFVENVGVMGGKNNAVQTQGSLMRSLGAIEAIVEAMRLPMHMVNARAWKRVFALDADKAAGLDMARRLYPAVQAELKRQKDHNRAEALLIAHYGVREVQG